MKAIVLSGTRLLIASAAIAALASCGGGGGDGGGVSVPTAPLTLNAANADNVTTGVVIDAFVSLNFSGPALVVPFSANGQSTAQPKTHFLSRFISREFARVNQYLQSQSRILPKITTTDTTTCDTGSITISDNRVNVSDPITSGSETFNACFDSFSGITLNGSITFSNITSTGATVSFSLTFSGTGFSLTTSGNFSFSETTVGTVTTITLQGTELSTTLSGIFADRHSDFSFVTSFDSSTNIFTDTFSFTYASSAIGGSVTVTTPTPFQTNFGNFHPHTGQMLIVGASGGRIQVTVLGNENAPAPQVEIKVDADNIGGFETTVNTTWLALEALAA